MLDGKLFEIVVYDSGWFCDARSRQVWKAALAPSFACSAPSRREEAISLPPPLPKTAPISEAAAATSLRVHGLALLCVLR